MSNARFFSAIALTAVVTGTLVAGLTHSRPALAAPTAGASVCKLFLHNGALENWPKFEANMATWLDERRASGLQDVSMVAIGTHGMLVCAW